MPATNKQSTNLGRKAPNCWFSIRCCEKQPLLWLETEILQNTYTEDRTMAFRTEILEKKKCAKQIQTQGGDDVCTRLGYLNDSYEWNNLQQRKEATQLLVQDLLLRKTTPSVIRIEAHTKNPQLVQDSAIQNRSTRLLLIATTYG